MTAAHPPVTREPDILVLGGSNDLSDYLRERLRPSCTEVVNTDDWGQALAMVEEGVGLVLARISGSFNGKLALLGKMKKASPATIMMVVGDSEDPDEIVQTLRRGIYDYFTEPVDRQLLGDRVARALQRRKAGEELKRRTESLRLVGRVARELTSSQDFRTILERLLAALAKEIHFDQAIVSVLGAKAFRPFTQVCGASSTRCDRGRSMPLEGTAHGVCSDRKRTVLVGDTSHSDFRDARLFAEQGYRSFVVVPSVGRDNILGAVALCSREAHAFDLEHCEVLDQISAMVTNTLGNIRLHVKSQRAATLLKESVRRKTEEIQDINEYMDCLFENAGDAILTTDLNGKVTSCNNSATDLIGKDRGRVVGQLIGDVLPLESPGALDAIVATAREEKRSIRGLECQFRRGGGEMSDISLTVSPITDHSWDLIGMSVVARDVTESLQLQREVAHAEKLATIGQIAAGVIHNAASSLSAISGRAEIVMRSAKLSQKEQEHLHKIVSSVDNVWGALKGILGFSRKDMSEKQAHEIPNIVSEVVDMVRFRSTSKKVRISVSAADSLPKVHCSHAQLMQAFLNIADNAIDAAANGGHLDIWIREGNMSQGGPAVLISFVDDGVGMDRQTLSRVFDPFFTTKAETKGTGLGMPVARRIVAGHGGEVHVKSKPGQGTTCVVSLPAEEIEHELRSEKTGGIDSHG